MSGVGAFQCIGDLAASQLARTKDLMDQNARMAVLRELKIILRLFDLNRDKPPGEQLALVRSHVAATTQEVASEEVRVGG